MKNIPLHTLVLLAIFYPVPVTAHYAERYTVRKTHHAWHYRAGTPYSHITCEMVRTYVAQTGSAQALAMAQSVGITASEMAKAKRCLGK
jgi:hypothetical protein